MNFLKNIDDDFTLILSLNDNAADGRDISWIWDVDFAGIFEKANVKEIYVTGKRCYDMAVRVKYEGVGNREIKIIEMRIIINLLILQQVKAGTFILFRLIHQ